MTENKKKEAKKTSAKGEEVKGVSIKAEGPKEANGSRSKEENNPKTIGKIVKTIALVAIAGFLIALLVFNAATKPSNKEQVWDMRTTIGKENAKNYYVMYTDLACPYCDVFSRDIMENQEEFEKDYIEGKDILFEVRVTDFLYEYGSNNIEMSRWGATATYCATQEDRFWDYYHEAISSLWKDYHSKGIGSSKTAPAIKGMTSDYWVKIGKKVGMNEDNLAKCMSSDETIEAVEKMTEKTSRVADGMPYFVFGKFKTSGFDNAWGFEYVKKYLDAGLKQ